jgi:hypothetical protein
MTANTYTDAGCKVGQADDPQSRQLEVNSMR